MTKTPLLASAALLASVALASAQMGPPSGEKQMPGAAGERSQGSAGDRGAKPQMQERGSEPARELKREPSETREAPRAQQKQERSTTGQGQRDDQRDEMKRDAQPQKQDQPKKAEPQKQDQPRAQDQRAPDRATTGQGQRDAQPQRQETQKPDAQKDQQRAQDRDQDRAPQQRQGAQQQGTSGQADAQTDAQGRVTLNTEQRTRIQQTVLAKADVPRVSRVDFSISVGTVVPSHVTFVEVPPALIEINPAWRGHRYFVVEEEIVIVSPQRRIVAVIPVGRGHASGSSTSMTVVELPPDEVRILQQVLVDRGFSVEVDGVFGPRTREALIAFQRREGLQATGQIDSRTVTALGVQGRISVQGDAQGTVGSGQQSQQPGQQSQQPAQRQGQPQQGTTGSATGQDPGSQPQGTTGSGDTRQPSGADMKQQPGTGGQQQTPGAQNPMPQNRPAQSPSGSSQ